MAISSNAPFAAILIAKRSLENRNRPTLHENSEALKTVLACVSGNNPDNQFTLFWGIVVISINLKSMKRKEDNIFAKKIQERKEAKEAAKKLAFERMREKIGRARAREQAPNPPYPLIPSYKRQNNEYDSWKWEGYFS